MPITKSAKKALRSSARKQVFNLERKEQMKGVLKKIKKLVSEKKTDEVKKMLPEAYQAIDKAVKRGLIKANTGSRKKSRLAAAIKKIS